MSDLSRLLEDVYGDGTGDAAPLPAPPEWSSDEALEDTFASWVPGPPADAPAAERAYADAADAAATAVSGEQVEERPSFEEVFSAFAPDDASTLARDAAAATEPAVVAEPTDLLDAVDVPGVAAAEPVAPFPIVPLPSSALPSTPAISRWMPSDDDILPLRGSAAKRLPKPVKAPKEPTAPRPKLELRRKAAAAPTVEAAPSVDGESGADNVEASAARRRGRRPAPKHAKPRAGFQLSRKVKAAPVAPDEVVEADTPKRRSFRLR